LSSQTKRAKLTRYPRLCLYQAEINKRIPVQLINFILHLRLHYQFLLLSGGFLLGGLMANEMNTLQFWLQFLNVHVLLFGGATAFNSWWDKDEGPIGGLKNPPEMRPWMRTASLGMMFLGLIWAFTVGWIYSLVYLISLILFWLYSTPAARWKGDPILSLFAIAFSTGFNSVLLGALAAGGAIDFILLLSATGASLVLLSLYPVSQIFQTEEDLRRNDRTFAAVFGLQKVRMFFAVSFITGAVLLCSAVYLIYPIPALILLGAAMISWIILMKIILKLKGAKDEYDAVMKMKFLASFSFVVFLIAANAIRYEWIGQTGLLKYFI